MIYDFKTISDFMNNNYHLNTSLSTYNNNKPYYQKSDSFYSKNNVDYIMNYYNNKQIYGLTYKHIDFDKLNFCNSNICNGQNNYNYVNDKKILTSFDKKQYKTYLLHAITNNNLYYIIDKIENNRLGKSIKTINLNLFLCNRNSVHFSVNQLVPAHNRGGNNIFPLPLYSELNNLNVIKLIKIILNIYMLFCIYFNNEHEMISYILKNNTKLTDKYANYIKNCNFLKNDDLQVKKDLIYLLKQTYFKLLNPYKLIIDNYYKEKLTLKHIELNKFYGQNVGINDWNYPLIILIYDKKLLKPYILNKYDSDTVIVGDTPLLIDKNSNINVIITSNLLDYLLKNESVYLKNKLYDYFKINVDNLTINSKHFNIISNGNVYNYTNKYINLNKQTINFNIFYINNKLENKIVLQDDYLKDKINNNYQNFIPVRFFVPFILSKISNNKLKHVCDNKVNYISTNKIETFNYTKQKNNFLFNNICGVYLILDYGLKFAIYNIINSYIDKKNFQEYNKKIIKNILDYYLNNLYPTYRNYTYNKSILELSSNNSYICYYYCINFISILIKKLNLINKFNNFNFKSLINNIIEIYYNKVNKYILNYTDNKKILKLIEYIDYVINVDYNLNNVLIINLTSNGFNKVLNNINLYLF